MDTPTPDGSFRCVLESWRQHESELSGYLRHRLGDSSQADDLVQEVFLKAMRHGGLFCDLGQPRAWLFQVARNALIDAARKERDNLPLPDDLPAPAATIAPIDTMVICLPQVLDRLRAEDRDILRQCDLGGMKQMDYALLHELTLPATKARLLRARKRMREELVRHCGVRFDECGNVCCHVGMATHTAA